MKRFWYASLLAIAFLLLIFWFRPASRFPSVGGTFIVGTAPDLPPYSFIDENNNITGFDIDVVKEVTRRIGYKIQIEPKPFTTLLRDLQMGQIHMIAAGMSPTPERSKYVRFTKPYLTGNPLVVLTKNKEITDLEDLKSKSVIVNLGYVADIYLSRFEDINLIRLNNVQIGFEALLKDKADAFVSALTYIAPYLEKHKDLHHFMIDETDESIALVVSKKAPEELFQKVQAALDDMEADGALASLKRKWAVA